MSRLGDWLRGRRKPDSEAAARIKDKVRLILGLPESVAISVNEIVCADPACPGMETVILVMQPGRKTVAFKVQSSMEAMSDEALTAAVTGKGSAKE
jgi:hypothetical protein